MPSLYRSTMSDLILLVREMISDTSGSPQFTDVQIQDRLDNYRDDIRYESLTIAPSIVNIGSTQNSASTIFADYYSSYQWWETDIVLQGQGAAPSSLPWIVLTPAASDYIVGHWQFETNVFGAGTVPGQLPPVFATGKVYDPHAAAADLLQFWSAAFANSYDISVDGQTLKRSQLLTLKLQLAAEYRKMSKPRTAKLIRSDIQPDLSSRRMRLLDEPDIAR